jgi:hypothetical protein
MHIKVGISGLILIVASTSSGQAQTTIDVSKITCDQFVHMKISSPRIIAAWLSGYYNAKQNNEIIETQGLQDNINKLERYCFAEKNFKVPVMKAVEDIFGEKKK